MTTPCQSWPWRWAVADLARPMITFLKGGFGSMLRDHPMRCSGRVDANLSDGELRSTALGRVKGRRAVLSRRAEASRTGCQMDIIVFTELMADDVARSLTYGLSAFCSKLFRRKR